MKSTEEDHCNHSGEHEDNYDGVDDAVGERCQHVMSEIAHAIAVRT